MSGGTITTTNGGLFGTLMSTPILNMPQSAILGLHKIQERPVAVAGKVEIRPMMYLALSYDHRIIDGREAVTFLVRVKEAIEDPQRLLIVMYGGDGRGRSQRLRGPAPEAPSRPSWRGRLRARPRSEEHTSELPSLMRISYAVFRWN